MKTTRSFSSMLTAVILLCASTAPRSMAGAILAAGNLVPCEVCDAQARRRVAVMPVNVGELPTQIRVPGAAAAERLRDRIESALSMSPTLIAVNRSHLDAVLTEQRLASSAAFSPAGRPQGGRMIAAQLLLYADVERLDVSTRTENNTTDDTADFVRQANERESAAASADATAEEIRRQTELLTGALGAGGTPMGAAVGAGADIAASSAASRGSALRNEAADLRERARLDSTRTADRRDEITVELVIGWRAIDVATGRVVANGRTSVKEKGRREAHVVQTASSSKSVADDTPDSAIVNRATDRIVDRLRKQIELSLSQEPFRAKVAAISGEQVILNAGSDIGVRVGDVFGIRRVNDSIVDPDTGLALRIETAPLGALQVERVQDGVSFARIVRQMSAPRVGDDLEWVGLLVSPEQLPRVRAESERRKSAREARLAEARLESLQEEREQHGTRTPATDLFDRFGGDPNLQAVDRLVRN